jgi:hypothetical protein
MARLDSASRLRWPRRMMVSMTSLRNRLAEAPSPSSPLRSRYSQAIWSESSRSWESETAMSKKRTRTARVPCHLRFGARSYFDRNRLGPKDDIAKHVGLRRVQGVADREARIPPIASEGVVHGCDLPSQQAPGETACAPRGLRRSVRERPPAFPLRRPSAVLSRRMVNSMAPSGNSRHRSTSLM